MWVEGLPTGEQGGHQLTDWPSQLAPVPSEDRRERPPSPMHCSDQADRQAQALLKSGKALEGKAVDAMMKEYEESEKK